MLPDNPINLSAIQRPYFYETNLSEPGTRQTLSESTSKHCVQVLRMQVGDQLQLTDGRGRLALAELSLAHKKHSQVKILEIRQIPPPSCQITLAIAPTKNIGRMEWLLEKLTEIGISSIILMATERTERTAVKLERLQQILISAMLQSRQVYLPALSGLIKFDEVLSGCGQYTHKWIAHCLEDHPKKILPPAKPHQSHIILIGPEGDFSAAEIASALGSENEFEAVTLGPTRLRTETAGMVAGVLLKLR